MQVGNSSNCSVWVALVVYVFVAFGGEKIFASSNCLELHTDAFSARGPGLSAADGKKEPDEATRVREAALKVEELIERETMRLMSERPHLTAKQARALVVSKNYFAFFDTAGKILLERDYYLQAIMRNLIAKGHVLILGPPGNAKTLSIKTIFENIVERSTGQSSFFRAQMTPETTLSDTHGGLNYEILTRTGRQRRLYDEGALGSLFAYFNEKFDARPNALRNPLELMAEGTHSQGNQTHKGKTWIVVGDSNRYLPEVYEKFNGGDEPRAVLDRYSEVLFFPAELEHVASNRQLIQGAHQKGVKMPKLNFEDILDIHSLVPDVKIPNHVADLITLLQYNLKPAFEMREQAAVDEYQEKLLAGEKPVQPYRSTKYMSDRTKGKAAGMLKAIVVLDYLAKNGERELVATTADLQELVHFYTLGGPRSEFVAKQKARAAKAIEREQLKTIENEREIFKETLDNLLQDFVAEIATVDAQKIEAQVRRYKRLNPEEKRELLEELKNLYHEATLADQTQNVDQLDAKTIARAALKDAVEHWIQTAEPDRAERLFKVFGKGRFFLNRREPTREWEDESATTEGTKAKSPRRFRSDKAGSRFDRVEIGATPFHTKAHVSSRGLIPAKLEHVNDRQARGRLLRYGESGIDIMAVKDGGRMGRVLTTIPHFDTRYVRGLANGDYIASSQLSTVRIRRNGEVENVDSNFGGNAVETFPDGSVLVVSGGEARIYKPGDNSYSNFHFPKEEVNHASLSRDGHIWVASTSGLSKVHRDLRVEHVDGTPELLNATFSVFELNNGSLIVGSSRGLLHVAPDMTVTTVQNDVYLFARPIDDRFVVAVNAQKERLEVIDLTTNAVISVTDQIKLGSDYFRIPIELSEDKTRVYLGAGPMHPATYIFELKYQKDPGTSKVPNDTVEAAPARSGSPSQTGTLRSAKVVGPLAHGLTKAHAVMDIGNGQFLVASPNGLEVIHRDGSHIRTISGNDGIHLAPFNSESVMVSPGYGSERASIVNIKDGTTVRNLDAHNPVKAVKLDADHVATLSFEHAVVVHQLSRSIDVVHSTKRARTEPEDHSPSDYSLDLIAQADKSLLVASGNRVVYIGDPMRSTKLPELVFTAASPVRVLLPINQDHFLVFTADGEVQSVQKVSSGWATKRFSKGDHSILSAARINEDLFAFFSEDGVLRFFDNYGRSGSEVHQAIRLSDELGQYEGFINMSVSADKSQLIVFVPNEGPIVVDLKWK